MRRGGQRPLPPLRSTIRAASRAPTCEPPAPTHSRTNRAFGSNKLTELSVQTNPQQQLTRTRRYVANLPVDMDDSKLTRMFMAFGPVSSVKIMQVPCVLVCTEIRFRCATLTVLDQPKTDEQRALQRHVGFVNFVSGRDAEKAKDALHGFTIDGAGDV